MRLLCHRGQPYEYTDDDTGKRYFSVSQVLTVLDPHAFDDVDPFVLAAAQNRGDDLHVIFGLLLLSEKGLCERPVRPPGVLGGYFDGMVRFVHERVPAPVKIEEAGVNDRDGYAGRVDTQCRLDHQPELWTIDLKTGGPRAVHSAQLVGGYKYLTGYEQSKRFASLYVRKNGTYRLEEHTHNHVDRAWFLSGLAVLKGRRYHQIT